MNTLDDKVIKLMAVLGWILVGLGSFFTIGAFVEAVRSSKTVMEPIWVVFFIGLIFCSLASGMFFVVLSILARSLKQIEKNTAKQMNAS